MFAEAKHVLCPTLMFCKLFQAYVTEHDRTVNDSGSIIHNKTNKCAYLNCIITCYSLPTCFNRCHGHHQGYVQHYNESKQTVKMHK